MLAWPLLFTPVLITNTILIEDISIQEHLKPGIIYFELEDIMIIFD